MLSPRAQPVRVFVVGDPVQPGRQGCLAPERCQPLPSFHKCLLRQVFRDLNAARQMAEQSVDARVLLCNEPFTHLPVTTQDLSNQPAVPHTTARLSSTANDIEPAAAAVVHGAPPRTGCEASPGQRVSLAVESLPE
jgi:hypothetical protein